MLVRLHIVLWEWLVVFVQNNYAVGFYTVPCSRRAQMDNILSGADAIRVMFIGATAGETPKGTREDANQKTQASVARLRSFGGGKEDGLGGAAYASRAGE